MRPGAGSWGRAGRSDDDSGGTRLIAAVTVVGVGIGVDVIAESATQLALVRFGAV